MTLAGCGRNLKGGNANEVNEEVCCSFLVDMCSCVICAHVFLERYSL
jgi:hypothetical protein